MAIALVCILAFGPLAALGLWGLSRGRAWGGWVVLFAGSVMLARASNAHSTTAKALGFALTGAFGYAAFKAIEKGYPGSLEIERHDAEYFRLPGYTGPMMQFPPEWD
jgi:hypothetical protein